ncbi:MAG TPA: hypothetical protein VII94_00415 [Candidatus Saccharimonadales bacterium]
MKDEIKTILKIVGDNAYAYREDAVGNKFWYLISISNPLYKIDGWWYFDEYLHREDGPACIYVNGFKWWFLNGKRHRINGPAIKGPNGYKEWYYHNTKIDCSTQKEFERLLRLKAFW